MTGPGPIRRPTAAEIRSTLRLELTLGGLQLLTVALAGFLGYLIGDLVGLVVGLLIGVPAAVVVTVVYVARRSRKEKADDAVGPGGAL